MNIVCIHSSVCQKCFCKDKNDSLHKAHNTHTHTHTHTRTHARTHARARTHAHTHTHAHTQTHLFINYAYINNSLTMIALQYTTSINQSRKTDINIMASGPLHNANPTRRPIPSVDIPHCLRVSYNSGVTHYEDTNTVIF